MTPTAALKVHDNLQTTIHHLFRTILEMDTIGALFIPQRLPMAPMVMPTLVCDADRIDASDPLAPAFPFNAAKAVARLTRRPSGKKLAVVLRPCEMRALVELVKLKQGALDDIVLIGFDCLGAHTNRDYFRFVETVGDHGTTAFVHAALTQGSAPLEGFALAPACQICENFLPAMADIHIGLLGVDTAKELLLEANSEAGRDLLASIETVPTLTPPGRQAAIQERLERNTTARDQRFAHTAAATASLEDLNAYLAHCVNCYNCRVACPVCYCKTCVFVTDVFDHDAFQYLEWARLKGRIKMPTDTVFYHLTRLAHMSTACVGCGQCSNACPNDIPVMELFRRLAHKAQAAFDYQAGRRVDEKPPLSTFEADEYQEVVGLG